MQSKLGWSESALVEGAKDARLSPAIVGAFPRKEAALVEVGNFFSKHLCTLQSGIGMEHVSTCVLVF